MYPNARNLLLCLLCLSPACYAEKADRDKPMYLESDKMVIDDAQHISTFTGNVQITQGTRILRGDKIVVTQDKDGFQHGVVTGNPASFRQKRDGVDEYVEGYGERIEYDSRAETLNFYNQARIKRNLDEVRGDHIIYSAKTEVFQVNSGATTAPNAPPKRVKAVLQPKPKGPVAAPSGEPVRIRSSEQLSPAE